MLVVPDGKAELQHFKDKWVTPQQMIVVCENEQNLCLIKIIVGPRSFCGATGTLCLRLLNESPHGF